MFDDRKVIIRGWERTIAGGADMACLSQIALDKMRHALTDANPRIKDASDEIIMRQYGFLTNGRLNNAAIVVAAQQPSEFLSQTRIRVSLYASKDKQSLISVRLFDISLIEAVDGILDYIQGLYPVKNSIGPKYRNEHVSISMVALREGILNSVVHRIYDDPTSFVAIDIYSDRLEIINSGELLGGLTVESLAGPHNSLLRNPDIANAFYMLKFIEMAGSGTLRIIRECKEYRCDLPVWKSEGGFVSLTFPNIHHDQKAVEGRNWNRVLSNLSGDSNVNASLSSLLGYIGEHENVKIAELGEVTGKSYATIKRYLQLLKEAGLVQYVGSRKTGGWNVVS